MKKYIKFEVLDVEYLKSEVLTMYDVVAVFTNDRMDTEYTENKIFITNTLDITDEGYYFLYIPTEKDTNDLESLAQYIINMVKNFSLIPMVKRALSGAIEEERNLKFQILNEVKDRLSVKTVSYNVVQSIKDSLGQNKAMQREELEAILKQNVKNDLEEYFSRVQNFLVNHNRRSKRIIEEAIKRLKDKEFLERYFEIYDYTLYVDKLTDLVVSGVLNSADLVGIIGQMVFLDDYFKELKKRKTILVWVGMIMVFLLGFPLLTQGIGLVFLILGGGILVQVGYGSPNIVSKSEAIRFKKHPRLYKKFCKMLEKEYMTKIEQNINYEFESYVNSCCEALLMDLEVKT